jgi:FAD/FMN-containing dehydrogenase
MASTELRLPTPPDDFAGDLIRPGDPRYHDARRIFNAMIDRRPAVIAQCATTQDVGAAIRLGHEHGLEIAIRGGGHGVAGTALADGGIVIDLRHMNRVTVDPRARTATAGGGATMSDLDRATEPHGLATTGGPLPRSEGPRSPCLEACRMPSGRRFRRTEHAHRRP